MTRAPVTRSTVFDATTVRYTFIAPPYTTQVTATAGGFPMRAPMALEAGAWYAMSIDEDGFAVCTPLSRKDMASRPPVVARVTTAALACNAPAPDRSGRQCDKPQGHDGPHWTYGGATLEWPRVARPLRDWALVTLLVLGVLALWIGLSAQAQESIPFCCPFVTEMEP